MSKVILFSCILALGTLLFFQWRHWPPELPAEPPRSGTVAPWAPSLATGEKKPLDLLSPPLHEADYASIVERPLFRPDRRPPEKEPETQPEPAPEPGSIVSLDTMDLVAVLITPGTAIAWVRTQADPTPRRFRVGDTIEGWRLKAIHPNELELSQGGKTDWLVLRNYAQPFQPKLSSRQRYNRRSTPASRPRRRPRPPARGRPSPKSQKHPQSRNPASKPSGPHLGPGPSLGPGP